MSVIAWSCRINGLEYYHCSVRYKYLHKLIASISTLLNREGIPIE